MRRPSSNRLRGFTPLQIKMVHGRSYKFVTGFTLIELMIAAAIVIIAVSALLQLFIYTFTLSSEASQITTAAARAYGLIDQIRLHNYSSIMADYNGATYPIPEINGTATVTTSYVAGKNSELLNVAVNVVWVSKGDRNLSFVVTSLIAMR